MMMTSGKILVVDDDGDVLRMVGRILSMAGFDVELSPDGEDALRKARELKPDLVLLDIMMPDKDGFEVMAEMRSDPRTRDIPILFLSAVTDEESVVRGLKGADDYIIKPFKPLELETRVRKILERMRAGRPGRAGAEAAVTDRLPLQFGNETYLVPSPEIYYVEAKGKYCYVHTRSERFLSGYSIGELEERFRQRGKFIRVHRSFMVNIDNVSVLRKNDKGRMELVLGNEGRTHIPVSDSYFQALKGTLGI